MSDNLSGVSMPVTQSVDMPALTPSADLSGYDDLVHVLYDGANLSDDMVQSLYECKANIANPSDGMYVSQLLLGKNQHVVRSPNSLDQEQVQGEAGRKGS